MPVLKQSWSIIKTTTLLYIYRHKAQISGVMGNIECFFLPHHWTHVISSHLSNRSLIAIFLSLRQWTDVGAGQMPESLLLSSWDSVTVTLSWTCSQCCCSQNNTNPQSARIDPTSPPASAWASLSLNWKTTDSAQREREREGKREREK